MDKKSGFLPDPVTLISLVISLILAVSAGAGVLKNWFGFNLDEFDGAKVYFQTPSEQAASNPTSAHYYDGLGNIQLLKDAADCLSDSSQSNEIPQAKEMIDYYSKAYVVMPHVYNKISEYNTNVSISAIKIVVVWIFSLWAVYLAAKFYSRGPAEDGATLKTSKALKKTVSKLEKEVEKLKANQPQIPPNIP